MNKMIGVLSGTASSALLGFLVSIAFYWNGTGPYPWELTAIILSSVGAVMGLLVSSGIALVDDDASYSWKRFLGYGILGSAALHVIAIFFSSGDTPLHFIENAVAAILTGISIGSGYYSGARALPEWMERRLTER